MTAIGKVTSKGQTTIPQQIRLALNVQPGDLVVWEIGPEGAARVRRVQPLDLEYLRAVEATLTEWASAEDEEAFVTFEAFQVVRVPFPFTDRTAFKNRPAVVLSQRGVYNEQSGHSVMATVTRRRQSTLTLDVRITDLAAAGLPSPSTVRLKLLR